MTKKKLIDVVKDILTNYPETRSCDHDLFRHVFSAYGVNTSCCSYDHVINCIKAKQIPTHESIRRSRQKHQETNPFLRSGNYEKRQDAGEKVKELVNSDFQQASMIF